MINPNYVDGLELKIKELAAERDAALAQSAELVAQNNLLLDSLKYAENKLYILVNTDGGLSKQVRTDALKAFDNVKNTIAATPQQCLRQIQADAGRAGFIAGLEWLADYDGNPDVSVAAVANQYAERVKAGE